MGKSPNSGYTLSVQDVVALEKIIEKEGIPLAHLMRNAGKAVAERAAEFCNPPAKVTIFCGSGNNGGDGWVAAGALVSLGYEVDLISILAAEDIKAEPARSIALEVSKSFNEQAGLRCHVLPETNQIEDLITSSCCIIDALLGAGFSGNNLREPLSTWVQTINDYRRSHLNCMVLAVDTPSGLCAQTGEAATPCIAADTTITMLSYKPGLLTPTAQTFCGELCLAELTDLSPYQSWLKQHEL